jgi:hypothetical protein
MEGYFPPEDRDKWIKAIEDLSNINKLVQEDIRDMILTGNDEKYRNPQKVEKAKEITKSIKKKKSSNKLLNSDNTLSDSSQTMGHDKKRDRNSRHQTKIRSTSKKSTSRSINRDKEKKVSHRSDSMDSTDRIISTLPKDKNGLRPPYVWNFPIERIEEIRDKLQKDKNAVEEVHRSRNKRMTKKQQKQNVDIVIKEHTKKNEIRKLNAYPFYHDGRIERFIDLFNELFINCMKYSKSKGNTWEYVYCKILKVLGVEYIFKPSKEEENENIHSPEINTQNENKEEEKNNEKEEKTNEEKKDNENELNKEETTEKNNENETKNKEISDNKNEEEKNAN